MQKITHLLTCVVFVFCFYFLTNSYKAAEAIGGPTELWLEVPFLANQKWKVYNGYNHGPCHYAVQTNPTLCGQGDQKYSFDLVPVNGDAGDQWVLSPVEGKVLSNPFLINGGDGGKGVKIQTDDGYIVHIYHLMYISPGIKKDYRVHAGEGIGYVYNHYDPINHIHIHVSYKSVSVPMRIAGYFYNDKGGENQWRGREIQMSWVFSGKNYHGNINTTFNYPFSSPDLRNICSAPNHCWFMNDMISSLQVNQGCSITLYNLPNYRGKNLTFMYDVPDLSEYYMNNKASSLKFICNSQ